MRFSWRQRRRPTGGPPLARLRAAGLEGAVPRAWLPRAAPLPRQHRRELGLLLPKRGLTDIGSERALVGVRRSGTLSPAHLPQHGNATLASTERLGEAP